MTPIHIPLRRMSLSKMPDLAQKPPAHQSIIQEAQAPSDRPVLRGREPETGHQAYATPRWMGIHWYRELPDWQPVEVY